MKTKLILASKSPRRLEILKNVGITPEVIISEVDEDIVDKNLDPFDYVMELASLKANAVVSKVNDGIIIGADTIVVSDDLILGQPKDEKDAYNMLKSLSNKTHSVVTGVSIRDVRGRVEILNFAETLVTFKELTDEEINKYIQSGEPMDKAGAYGIQGIGGLFVEKIEGSYFNVVGLPINLVYESLLELNFKIL